MINRQSYKRSGVTIIEVLFSIAIVITGLLGVAGLIMIAGTQMTQGLEADAMSNAGLNAIAEFDTRKMRRPDSLLWYNPTTNTFTSILSGNLYGPGRDNRWGEAGINDDTNGPIDDIFEAGYFDDVPSPSFCIDPFFIAKQVVDRNPNRYEYNTFPGIDINDIQYSGRGIMTMRRVTLKNLSGVPNPDPPYPNGTQNILTLLQSHEIFTIKDDLTFNTPTAATELPQQQWITDQAIANGPSPRGTNGIDDDHDGVIDEPDEANVKRLNLRETSWLATLTPNRMRNNSGTREPTDQYLISIVVFNNRFMDYVVPNSAPAKDRLLDVQFQNAGFGGGEVQLSHTDPNALELRHGDWVMLSANSQIGACHRWYRITYIEDETYFEDETGVKKPIAYRNATLRGSDWSRPEWHTVGGYPTHATYIPGVIGVFEKTIRLESTSLY